MSEKKKTTRQLAAERLLEDDDVRYGNWFVRYCYRPKFLLLLAFIPLAIVVVPKIRQWMPDLSQSKDYQIKSADIKVTPPPRWVPEDIVEQVIQKASLPEKLSLLNEQLTSEIAAAFEQHPWVKEVLQVQKKSPAGISVELKYRKPAAMISVKQRVYPVSEEGVFLPPGDFSQTDTERYPLVINVQSVPQGSAGELWGDPTVLGAARLAKSLQDSWKSLHLAAIEVPNQIKANEKIGEMTFRLITIGGSEIIWGKTAGVTPSKELSVSQKIKRLQNYQKKFGRLDRPIGPYEIDIRYLERMVRKPLSQNGLLRQ
ncbi:hypothetical protein MNBD_PLANCTO02-1418 [hydrothermal vent metagenome]|uniref:POTRA domain-containing protein n=1 Tax=hydrothermal vent metagenome TaxID=652676 RepID=A0A3B1DI61_9ZZZZ